MNLQNQHILFFSLPRHDERYTSTPWQLASEFANDNEVIFMDHPYTFVEMITKFRTKEVRKRIKAYFGKKYFWKGDVEVLLTPFVWPLNFLSKGKLYNYFSAMNEKIVAKRLNQFLTERKIDSLIYVNSFEFYYPHIKTYLKADVKLSVYHCIDPIIKQFTAKHGNYLQQQTAHDSDIIISTSPSLKENFKNLGFANSYLVPNAANFTLFNSALNGDLKIHNSLENINGKVIGFLGNIERRTDFKLLLHTINKLKDWTLVMAGPVERSFVPDALWNHPRAKFTGAVSHSDAPRIIKRFDVAIIPFQCDEASSSIYPLKLFEYLAAGKPLVTTNFNPEVLTGLHEVIEIAYTYNEFSDKIANAFKANGEMKIKQRISKASQNTWKERASLFSDFIHLHLPAIVPCL